MSYEIYKLLHLFGLVTLFASLGALTVVPFERRKPFMMLHGIATVIMLVAGFGLLARLNLLGNLGQWVYGKIAIWLVLGVTPFLLKKKPNLAMPVLISSLVCGAIAAGLAIYKPGA